MKEVTFKIKSGEKDYYLEHGYGYTVDVEEAALFNLTTVNEDFLTSDYDDITFLFDEPVVVYNTDKKLFYGKNGEWGIDIVFVNEVKCVKVGVSSVLFLPVFRQKYYIYNKREFSWMVNPQDKPEGIDSDHPTHRYTYIKPEMGWVDNIVFTDLDVATRYHELMKTVKSFEMDGRE